MYACVIVYIQTDAYEQKSEVVHKGGKGQLTMSSKSSSSLLVWFPFKFISKSIPSEP